MRKLATKRKITYLCLEIKTVRSKKRRLMKILRTTKEYIPKIWKNYGIDVVRVSPCILSAITALKIAREADRSGCMIVEVYSLADAIAAVSARKIARLKFGIVYSVPCGATPPKGIASEIRREVDAWVFTGESSAAAYPTDLRNKTIIGATHFGIQEIHEEKTGTPQTYLMAGPLTDFNRLRQAITDTDAAPEGTILRICGTGKARYVMAEVRYARHIRHPERIQWTGDNSDPEKEALLADAAIKGHDDVTAIEAYIMSLGLPLYNSIGSCEQVDRSRHMPCFHVEQYRKLYNLIRE